MAWWAGFADEVSDARDGGGDVSGGGFVSVVLGEGICIFVVGKCWDSAEIPMRDVYGVVFGWDCKA